MRPLYPRQTVEEGYDTHRRMATVAAPISTTEEIQFVIDSAGSQYPGMDTGLIFGLPVVAFLSGSSTLLFYVHVGLGAFWFGLDFFFRYVMAPALEKAGPDTAISVIPHLTPKIMIFGESLTLGTIGGYRARLPSATGVARRSISGARSV